MKKYPDFVEGKLKAFLKYHGKALKSQYSRKTKIEKIQKSGNTSLNQFIDSWDRIISRIKSLKKDGQPMGSVVPRIYENEVYAPSNVKENWDVRFYNRWNPDSKEYEQHEKNTSEDTDALMSVIRWCEENGKGKNQILFFLGVMYACKQTKDVDYDVFPADVMNEFLQTSSADFEDINSSWNREGLAISTANIPHGLIPLLNLHEQPQSRFMIIATIRKLHALKSSKNNESVAA